MNRVEVHVLQAETYTLQKEKRRGNRQGPHRKTQPQCSSGMGIVGLVVVASTLVIPPWGGGGGAHEVCPPPKKNAPCAATRSGPSSTGAGVEQKWFC